jgi:hypothetical protein
MLTGFLLWSDLEARRPHRSFGDDKRADFAVVDIAILKTLLLIDQLQFADQQGLDDRSSVTMN